MHLKRYSDTTLDLTGSTFKSLNFITDTKKPCINKLVLTKSTYDKIRLNYAAAKVDDLKTFAKTITK